jgi:4-alpha-glucanotransferase
MLTRLDSICLDCEKETAQRDQLYQKRMKQEAVVRQFENSNEGYIKIRKTAEEKVHSILLGRKELLGRAVLCMIESMREDPDKYGPLIYYNDNNASSITTTSTSTIAEYYNRQYYTSYTYGGGQQQQHYASKDSFRQAYIHMLSEEPEKLFNSLEKILVDEVIDQYLSKTPSSLPMLPPEQQQ